MHTFKLYQNKAGGAWQAYFPHKGLHKWFGTGEHIRSKAWNKAAAAEADILKGLELLADRAAQAAQAAATPVATEPSAETPGTQEAAPAKDQGTELPKLDLSQPPPRGSFRERIQTEVDFILKIKDSDTRKREATDAQQHLYQALGGYVDLPFKKVSLKEGELMVAFYNDPVRFRLTGKHYATIQRRFLTPMLASGLDREFFGILDRIKRQSDDNEASDPFRGDHIRRLHLRLRTGLEEDYLDGLYRIGCIAAPQLIDAALLVWEGVDFGTKEVTLYREKTNVIARFKMGKRLEEWLWRRRQESPKDHMHVFWELACLVEDRGKPDFNQSVITNSTRINSISSNTANKWREFMHRAGVPVDMMAFDQGDITDPGSFLEKLRLKSEPQYAWLFGKFGRNLQRALSAKPANEEEVRRIESMVINQLNKIIEGKYAYDKDALREVPLRPMTRDLSNPEFKGVRKVQFHRLFLEDAFPSLKRVKFCNCNYSYSSFRKGLVSFLRGIGFRDPLIAAILGQDALESQNTYDRVAEHELRRGCELAQRHEEAMIEGREEYYPSIPFDLYEPMVQKFQGQADQLQRFRAELEEIGRQHHEATRAAVQSGVAELREAFMKSQTESDARWQRRWDAQAERYARREEAREADHRRQLAEMEQGIITEVRAHSPVGSPQPPLPVPVAGLIPPLPAGPAPADECKTFQEDQI